MSVSNDKLFHIVHFIESDINKNKKCIDCVPSKWIFSNKETGQLMTKFMPPPYTIKSCTALHTLVQNNKSAHSKWPNYPIKILGSAGTFIYI
ncbi:hypothetical protein ALC57_01436 [Trachymyrmex cornetzi]|uniref:Uncharacterized protein n=1 Tax=Trachymyrmex cornetzi TaxID=471704 RepID=A0A151IUJ2_9HYME|nr:hypothetical protein ALC57_16915 [Trachymyrmex cornetzi]KYN29133.1 hypothetical protein ALC57_01436 [Trachymyrmex cornetzi]